MVYPALAYPTYEVGARLAGARAVATDALTALGPERVALVWLNSPSNPTGRVLPVDHLRKVVAWCRERGALLVSDECYLECAWEGDAPVSVLHPDVCDGDHTGILAVHSLSKRSNLAGYRCAFVAGDPDVVGRAARRPQEPRAEDARPAAGARCGPPSTTTRTSRSSTPGTPRRRRALRAALEAAGFRIDHSEASLYLWATRDEPCWDTVAWLAERGILVAPGEFYGAAGGRSTCGSRSPPPTSGSTAAVAGWLSRGSLGVAGLGGRARGGDRRALGRREDPHGRDAAHPDHRVLELLGVQHHAGPVPMQDQLSQ